MVVYLGPSGYGLRVRDKAVGGSGRDFRVVFSVPCTSSGKSECESVIPADRFVNQRHKTQNPKSSGILNNDPSNSSQKKPCKALSNLNTLKPQSLKASEA